MKTYPLAQRPTVAERKFFGFDISDNYNKPDRKIVAVCTQEKRTPKAGEWFLSGAIVEAYRADNDLSNVYNIAKLVLVQETITKTLHVIKQ